MLAALSLSLVCCNVGALSLWARSILLLTLPPRRALRDRRRLDLLSIPGSETAGEKRDRAEEARLGVGVDRRAAVVLASRAAPVKILKVEILLRLAVQHPERPERALPEPFFQRKQPVSAVVDEAAATKF